MPSKKKKQQIDDMEEIRQMLWKTHNLLVEALEEIKRTNVLNARKQLNAASKHIETSNRRLTKAGQETTISV